MRCLLHIGTHKTGTTSIQHFLRHHVGTASYPIGMIRPDQHSELANLAARPERTDMGVTAPETLTEAWRAVARAHIRAQVTSDVDQLIYSAENLSLLCHADEIAAVMDLLAGREVHVVMYTRNPTDFLASYSFTIGLFELDAPTRPDSINDLSTDSWLVDYQSRIDLWAHHAPVTVVDYDGVVARDGSVIPSFADLVGIAPVDYRLNTTAGLKDKIMRAIQADPKAQARLHRELEAQKASQPDGQRDGESDSPRPPHDPV